MCIYFVRHHEASMKVFLIIQFKTDAGSGLMLITGFPTLYIKIESNDLFLSETIFFICTFNEDMM